MTRTRARTEYADPRHVRPSSRRRSRAQREHSSGAWRVPSECPTSTWCVPGHHSASTARHACLSRRGPKCVIGRVQQRDRGNLPPPSALCPRSTATRARRHARVPMCVCAYVSVGACPCSWHGGGGPPGAGSATSSSSAMPAGLDRAVVGWKQPTEGVRVVHKKDNEKTKNIGRRLKRNWTRCRPPAPAAEWAHAACTALRARRGHKGRRRSAAPWARRIVRAIVAPFGPRTAATSWCARLGVRRRHGRPVGTRRRFTRVQGFATMACASCSIRWPPRTRGAVRAQLACGADSHSGSLHGHDSTGGVAGSGWGLVRDPAGVAARHRGMRDGRGVQPAGAP